MVEYNLIFQLNFGGLILEIIGFMLIILSESKVVQTSGVFQGAELKDRDTGKTIKETMMLAFPRRYRLGIAFVIVGLGFQIFALFGQ